MSSVSADSIDYAKSVSSYYLVVVNVRKTGKNAIGKRKPHRRFVFARQKCASNFFMTPSALKNAAEKEEAEGFFYARDDGREEKWPLATNDDWRKPRRSSKGRCYAEAA